MRQGLTAQVLEDRLAEQCVQLQAPNVAPAFTRGSTRKPSMSTSRAHVWIVLSQDNANKDIPAINYGKKATRSVAPFVGSSYSWTASKG